MKIILVAATDKKNAIGVGGRLPWNVKTEMKHFVNITKGKTVVMGRKTFESVGPLPDRNVIVLSRTMLPTEGIHVINGLAQLSMLANFMDDVNGEPLRELYVLGGEEVYNEFLPLANEIMVSRIQITVDNADAHFVDIKRAGGWERIKKERQVDEDTDIKWYFEHWVYKPTTTIGELEEAIFKMEGVRVVFRRPATDVVKNYPLYHRPLGLRSTMRPLVSRLVDCGFTARDFIIVNGHGVAYTYTDVMSGSARDVCIETVRRSYIARSRWL